MTASDRRELTTASRTQTQVLYGAPVRVLEQRAVRAALIDAVLAARDRAVALGAG